MSIGDPVGSVLTALRSVILTSNAPGDLSGAFARHVLADMADWKWHVDVPVEASAAQPVEYPKVAGLGYAVAAGRAAARAAFEDGIGRLRQRDPFPVDGQSFGRDPVALLGLALGAQSAGGDSGAWVGGLLADPRSADTTAFGDALNRASSAILRGSPTRWFPEGHAPDELAVAMWAERRGLFARTPPGRESGASALDDLRRLLLVDPATLDAPRAAVMYAAIELSLAGTLEMIGDRDAVATVLSRFEAAMRRWPRRGGWPIRDEKDVQALVFLLLRSVWADVVDEENIGKLGHSSYIPDFSIPSLRKLVEVKFARTRADLKKIEQELLLDSAAYPAAGRGANDSLVVFVYDDSSSVQDHDLLISAIESVEFVSRVVVVSRPVGAEE